MKSRKSTRFLFIVLAVSLFTSVLYIPLASAGGLKKVVAVSRFENKTSYGTGGAWDIGNGMSDQLTDALIQSGNFVVLERQTLGDVIGEQDLASSGRTMKSKSARTGKITSAQILIKGAITEYDRSSSGSDTGVSVMGVHVGGSKGEAHVGLIIRMIDTTTSEVLASKRVEGKAKSGGLNFGINVGSVGFGTKGFKKTPLGKATQIAIDNAVEAISSGLENIPYQGRVILVKGESLYLSAGTRTGAAVGDEFTVYSLGEELVDPDTGEMLGSEEEKLGKVKIYSVKEKFSKARAVGTLNGAEKGNIIRAQ
ncbi:MAG: CsgG/HfaB family protein [Thermodesulfobacteriota bacterium]